MFARLGTDYEIRNQCFFVILEAMATDHSGSVMTAFNRRSVRLSVRRNQIIIDLVLIHMVK